MDVETLGLANLIQKMRRRSMSWRFIGAQLHLTPTEARKIIYPEWGNPPPQPPRQKKKKGRPRKDLSKMPPAMRTKSQKAYIPSVAPFHLGVQFSPPPELLNERDRRNRLSPRSLTAAILGDPLPGYSALDRKANASS